MPQDDREEYRSSYGKRAATYTSGFERTAVRVPDGVHTFSIETAGQKRIDIVNYRVGQGNPCADPGTLHPERTFFIHRDIGPNQDQYICLAKTLNQPCPVCEYRAKLARRTDTDPKLLKDLVPKERQLWWVMDLADPAKGWQLWDASFHQFGKLLDKRVRERDPDEDWDLFAMATKGFTLKLGVTEKPLPTGKWFEVTTIDFKPREQQYSKDLYDKLACLDDLLIIPTYEKLHELFYQTPGAEGTAKPKPAADEEEEPTPPPKKKPAPPPAEEEEPAPPPKKKPAPAEDEAPAPPPKKKAPPPAEEEEAPPPPKKKAPPPADEEAPAPKQKPAPKAEDDWDDWDEPPKPKTPPKKPAAAEEE